MHYQIRMDEEKKAIQINDMIFPLAARGKGDPWAVRLPVSWEEGTGKIVLKEFRAGGPEALVETVRDGIQISRHEMGLKENSFTLPEYYEKWKQETKGSLAASTRQRKEDVFQQKVYPFFGDLPLEEISRKLIQEWKDMDREEKEARTFAAAYRLLRTLLGDAERQRYISARPVMSTLRKESCEIRTPLTVEQQELIYRNRNRDVMWAMMYIAMRHGLRLGEVLVLRLYDVDFVRKKLWVRHQYTTGRRGEYAGAVYKPYTKTKHIRAVDLEEESEKLIRRIWERQEPERHRHVVHYPDAFLFLDEKGMLIEPRTLRDTFASRMEGSGPRVTFHCLRNTFACNLYDQERDLQRVMRQLGATEQTALRYISRTECGTAFVAGALNQWIMDRMEEEEMTGDEREKQWEVFCEEPCLETQGNRITLSAASVGLLGHLPYVKMSLNAEEMQLTLRGSTIKMHNLPLEGHLIAQKEDPYAMAASWYVPGFAERLEGILGEGYNMQQGIRLMAQYDPGERTLLFGLRGAIQNREGTSEEAQPEKKKRGRRKTKETVPVS